jgi:hypothetical protein
MSRKYLIVLLVLVVGACSFFLYQSYQGPKAMAQREIAKVVADANSQIQAAGVTDTLLNDEVYTKTYNDLPTDVRSDLNQKSFFGNHVRSVVLIKASLATRAASVVLLGANWISKLADIAIGKQVSEKEFGEAAQLALTTEGIGRVGGPAADVTLKVFDVVNGAELATQAYRVAKGVTDLSPQVLGAKILAFGLQQQMNFINSRVSGAYQKIATLNPFTPGKTTIWFVWVRSGSQQGTTSEKILEKKGMLCYYLNAKNGRYELYFSDVVGTKLVIKKK